MRRFIRFCLFLAVLVAAGAWLLSRPAGLAEGRFDNLTGDAVAGEQVFIASGCASCHMSPGADEAEADGKLVLAGGMRFPSPYGTFLAPNISMSSAGIGDWTVQDLGNALLRGVSPEGQHYYPAFPYTSYARMTDRQVADLWAYMTTLPVDDTASLPHDIGFPFNIRRSLGLWKPLYLRPQWVLANAPDAQVDRGRMLVEALGHCAECHTPRDQLGGLQRDAWMTGAPNPAGRGRIPGIDPATLGWSVAEIAYYLETGFTPEFDTAGGHMVSVIENTAQLPESDRQAIAAYLVALR